MGVRRFRPLFWVLPILLTACALPQSDNATVALYVRNLDDDLAVLAVQPQTDPATTLVFAPLVEGMPNAAVGRCLTMPVGSALWVMDSLGLGSGGQPEQRLFTVTPTDTNGTAIVWVEIRADGVATTGRGLPDWWEGIDPDC